MNLGPAETLVTKAGDIERWLGQVPWTPRHTIDPEARQRDRVRMARIAGIMVKRLISIISDYDLSPEDILHGVKP